MKMKNCFTYFFDFYNLKDVGVVPSYVPKVRGLH